MTSTLALLNKLNKPLLPLWVLALLTWGCSPDQRETTEETKAEPGFDVIAYYTGRPATLEPKTVEQLTQIIYSFLHLQGDKLTVDDAQDSTSLANLVSLKKDYPHLKVLVSLGGWGGCETCSAVFSTPAGRTEFAQSVKDLLQAYGADGIDLDWEYPAIEGHPGHPYGPADLQNFTLLVQELRSTLGDSAEISFAAGGFRTFIMNSAEWEKVMPLVNRVNLMSYDLTNGYSPVTGHHTPLYSTASQIESTENGLRLLDSLGVPREKVVIGAAFYARVWEGVPNKNQGLHQAGKFKEAVAYRDLDNYFQNNPGFAYHWDSTAQAPYGYNPAKGLFATYDDSLSIARKTRFALENNLGGIMFWELSGDKGEKSLLEVIDRVKQRNGMASSVN